MMTIIFGLYYFAYDPLKPMEASIIRSTLFGLVGFLISLVIGFTSNLPKTVNYIDPKKTYDDYYMTDKTDDEIIATLAVTIANNTNKLTKTYKSLSDRYVAMLVSSIIGVALLLLAFLIMFVV